RASVPAKKIHENATVKLPSCGADTFPDSRRKHPALSKSCRPKSDAGKSRVSGVICVNIVLAHLLNCKFNTKFNTMPKVV
ncbi:hypothetical protein, partial [Paramuribaculum intestinale]|uniref:hypothetical protein n=1 Tax=Paramuribaculum intestinale TaxID=2094151 RepID=UPI0027306718